MPLVSVVLSSYNQRDYLRTSMESILKQTFQDFEILAMDDGSQDDSQEILRAYGDDERVRLFLFRQNRGGLECMREVIPQARGKYIAIHHSDDSWYPEKLARQVAWLEEHPEDWACFTWATVIDEDGVPWDESGQGAVFAQQNRSRQEWLRHFFYHGNCLCHPSLLIRSEAYRECGLMDSTGLWQLPDFFMWVRLCLKHQIHILPEQLTYFRVRRHSQESMSGDRVDMRVRDMYEHHLLMEEFAGIDSQDDFLQVFPEASKFLHDGQLDMAFALARICLEFGQPSYRVYALDTLHKLLKDKTSASRLAAWYDYGEREFIRDTGTYDAFGTKGSLPKIAVTMYWAGEAGYDEQHKITQVVWVTPTGHFETAFTLPEEEKARSFILNIHEGHLAHLRLEHLTAGGELLKPIPIGRLERRDGWDVFENLHPSYECFWELQGGERIDIRGDMDIREETLLSNYVNKIDEMIKDEREMADKRVLIEQNRIKEKERDILELHAEYSRTLANMERMKEELSALKNSRGMRLVQGFWNVRDRILGRR
ncbi:MAG: glycosyltransferase [Selenomonas sp.]|nr:glycosyltransferase [Selenomonas sp.]